MVRYHPLIDYFVHHNKNLVFLVLPCEVGHYCTACRRWLECNERRRGRATLVRRLRFARPPAAMFDHARVKQIPRILLNAATPYFAGGDFLLSETLFLIKSI
jgi:hypothetical protein